MSESQDTGYVRDLAFRSGMVPGQSPTAMAYAALSAGFVPPDPRAPFAYLDLGCGEGTTLLALASIHPQSRFFGVDFNSRHVETARAAAATLGLHNVSFHEATFLDLKHIALPERFEFIACNGIYGWLDPENMRAIDDFVGERLAEDGLFYVEYLSSPGKIAIAALWRFLREMVPLEEHGGDARARSEAALGWLERLARRGMFFFQQHPSALAAARHYLAGSRRDAYQIDHFAHNAMAEHFTPRLFPEIHARFAARGLVFAARADVELNDLDLAVPPAQVPTFREVTDPVRRELLKDFIRNEHDRRDVWSKGGRRDETSALRRLAEGYAILLRMGPERVQRQIAAPGGHRVALIGAAYDALIERSYDRPSRLADLGAAAEWVRHRRAFERLVASGQVFLLADPGFMPPLLEASEEGFPYRLSSQINRWLLSRAVERLSGVQLVAQATGGLALALTSLESLLLERALAGEADPVSAALARLNAAGEAPVATPQGAQPARALGEEAVTRTWQEFRQLRLPNMLRLHLLVAA